MRRPSEGTIAIGALIAFSFWIFVALPFLHTASEHHFGYGLITTCPAEESNNAGFWEKARCDPVAYFTLWLVVFTGVLAISTIGLWFVTWRSGVNHRRDMKQSIAVAERALVAAHRAWIKLLEVRVAVPLTLGGSAKTTISFRLTNTGQAPAINIRIFAWLTVFPCDPVYEQQRLCKFTHARPTKGLALFPGDTFPESSGMGGYGTAVEASATDVAQALVFSIDGSITLYVVGCVEYQFATDPEEHHQTGFVYQLLKTDFSPIKPSDGSILHENLKLMEYAFGGITAD